jgi:hypothetical protein
LDLLGMMDYSPSPAKKRDGKKFPRCLAGREVILIKQFSSVGPRGETLFC